MNLNPMSYLRNVRAAMRAARKFSNPEGDIAAIIRGGNPAGPWTGIFNGFEPRKINPHLYEGLREAIPILDGAINTLVTLDGIVRVEGDNGKLVAEIEDWMTNVPVNDAEKGLQSLYESQGNERYEQGVGIAEWMPDKRATDIVGLRVADSKGIYFRRTEKGLEVYYRPPGEQLKTSNGLDNVEALLRQGGVPLTQLTDNLSTWGYKRLDSSRLLYTVHQPEADNPYGTSVLRSLEFGGKSLLVIQNAMARVWERYGDPPMLAVLKVASRKVIDTPGELDRRSDAISKNLRAVLEAKGAGNSADLVQAIGKDDDFTITVLGAEGIALEIEQPARHLLEQIVSKIGLPAWMMGLQFSTSERLAEQQGGMALQASKTRWERRKPSLTDLVATMLRMRGRTWKPGDWKLYQELPNIQDQLKAAQAGFLRAQTAMMGGDAQAQQGRSRGIDNNLRASRTGVHKHKAANDEDSEGEPWADADPELPRIERRARAALWRLWEGLEATVMSILKLDLTSDQPAHFDLSHLPELIVAEQQFVEAAGGNDSAMVEALVETWRRAVSNAAVDMGTASAASVMTTAIADALAAHGLAQVADTTVRAYRERIVGVLSAGVLDGLAPQAIVAELKRRFDLGRYDWTRLVASELAAAYGEAKMIEFAANQLEEYDWSTADDESVCPICVGHREGGPYKVGVGPLPMTDSHPLCRCSVIPAL